MALHDFRLRFEGTAADPFEPLEGLVDMVSVSPHFVELKMHRYTEEDRQPIGAEGAAMLIKELCGLPEGEFQQFGGGKRARTTEVTNPSRPQRLGRRFIR